MKILEQLEKFSKKNLNFSNFKIDVGTSINAPYSAHWLNTDDSVCVLGIEPNIENIRVLKKGRDNKSQFCHIRLDDNAIVLGDTLINRFNDDKFTVLHCAIDNVNDIQEEDFYCTSDKNSGCSSLFKPTEKLDVPLSHVDRVEVLSLEYILNYISFPKDGHIMFVKTDTQGKDFDVVKSLGKYLKNVVALKCEYNTDNKYEIPKDTSREFYKFMISNGFILKNNNGYDFTFINNKFTQESIFNILPE